MWLNIRTLYVHIEKGSWCCASTGTACQQFSLSRDPYWHYYRKIQGKDRNISSAKYKASLLFPVSSKNSFEHNHAFSPGYIDRPLISHARHYIVCVYNSICQSTYRLASLTPIRLHSPHLYRPKFSLWCRYLKRRLGSKDPFLAIGMSKGAIRTEFPCISVKILESTQQSMIAYK